MSSWVTPLLLLAIVASTVSSLRCYKCNSVSQPDCVDNYSNFLQGCPAKSIAGKPAVGAVGCRKIVQIVGDDETVIRECAYSGENVSNKVSKGSTGITLEMSQCSDKHGCNMASKFATNSLLLALAAAFVWLLERY